MLDEPVEGPGDVGDVEGGCGTPPTADEVGPEGGGERDTEGTEHLEVGDDEGWRAGEEGLKEG